MPNAQVGAVMMLQGLLPLRLNCPWRVAATTSLVRSTMLGPSASIGAVQLAAPTLTTSTSLVRVPEGGASAVIRPESVYVALRIDTFASLGSGTKTQQK